MKNIICKVFSSAMLAALQAVLLSPMSANAGLITGVSATGGTVIDTTNNKEWLRLDVTTGQTIAGYSRLALQSEIRLLHDFFIRSGTLILNTPQTLCE